MKIQYEIAGGHKRGPNGLNDYIKGNPAKAPDEAAKEWIEAKYGSWIKTNISDDYIFDSNTMDVFVVDFTYEDDANAFVERLGGYALEA